MFILLQANLSWLSFSSEAYLEINVPFSRAHQVLLGRDARIMSLLMLMASRKHGPNGSLYTLLS